MPAGRPSKTRPTPIDENDADELARRRAIGLRLQDCRKAREWSLRDLANASRLTVPEIRRLELGQTDAKMSTLLRLAKALGCPEKWLLLGEAAAATLAD